LRASEEQTQGGAVAIGVQARRVALRLAQHGDRLGVGVSRHRASGDATQRFHGLVRARRARPMIRQALELPLHAVASGRFERRRGGHVHGLAVGREQALVRDLLGQCVVEREARIVAGRQLVDDVQTGQLGEVGRDRAGPGPGRLQQRAGKLTAEHGRRL
jgi:hypothetical protein